MGFPLLKRKFSIYITISALLLTAAASAFFFIKYRSYQKQPLETLHLAISKSFLSIPVYIADKRGFFTKEGIDVKIKEYPSGKLATNSMFNGENDISTSADMPIVINSFIRDDFCVIATFTYSYDMVKVVARKDSGIKTAKDLIDKKVGVNYGTSSHFYLASFLLFNGIPISYLKLVNMKTIDMPMALSNEEVDAVSVWEPYAHKAMKMLKNNAIVMKDPDIYRTTFSFVAKKQYIMEHEGEIVKFLRAIDDAVNFIYKNKEQSVDIIATAFNVDKKIVNNAWNKFVFGIFLDESLLISWDSIARWEIENKFVNRKVIPNYLNYICPEILKKVKPEALTIIY